MREELKAAAKDAGRSMNAEIIARLSGLDTVGLRDRFAGQALAGMVSHGTVPKAAMLEEPSSYDFDTDADYRAACPDNSFAAAAYRMADAMLAAREARS